MRLLPFFFVVLAFRNLAFGDEPSPLHRIAPRDTAALHALFQFNARGLPIVSAHRGGAAEGWPENCIETMTATLVATSAMMEVDPRFTKDGAIVLHHDATLDRTTTGTGRVADHTLDELKQLQLKDARGQTTSYRIPTLDEAMDWARGKTILVLDQKDVGIRERVAKVQEHHAEAFTILIVYSFDDARTCHQLAPEVMMEVMIPNQQKLEAFERTGVPWNRVVAFVGHDPPADPAFLARLHERGIYCMAGTSRNLDRRLEGIKDGELEALRSEYRRLKTLGVDLLETDRPREVGPMLFGATPITLP